MAFQISPGVVTKEIDLSSIIPAVSTTIAGYAAHFEWGPVNQLITVDSENNLVGLFGPPTADNYKEWFPAANYLGYGSNLRLARCVDEATAKNAAGPGTDAAILVENSNEIDGVDFAGGTTGHFVARYAGSKGNGLQVVMHDGGVEGGFSAGVYNQWKYASQFQSKMPLDTGWAETLTGSTGSYDCVNIAVIDKDGLFTGVKGTVLETFDGVSKALNAQNSDGTNNHYKNVINSSSRYIYVGGYPSGGSVAGLSAGIGISGATGNLRWGSALSIAGGSFDRIVVTDPAGSTAGYATEFTGGTGEYSGTISAGGSSSGFGLFSNSDTEDISLIICGPANSTLAAAIIDIADARKDCVAFLSPEENDVLGTGVPHLPSLAESNVIDYRDNQLNKSSSYAFLDSGWKYQYDRYSDVYRWVPLNGDVAGIAVRSDENTETWFSPAGFNRGQVRGVVKLAFNPSKTNRDNLYRDQINPVVAFPGEGTVLFGDKTLLAKPSSFDRLNVRRLFIVLEKAIATAAKYQLFEQNDTFTRSHFKTMVEPFLRDVKARRGITEFKVVCDASNNTAAVVDRNEFVADIFIKPTKSINFITLSFVATSQGVDFSEIGS
jgi:hypothetical protein